MIIRTAISLVTRLNKNLWLGLKNNFRKETPQYFDPFLMNKRLAICLIIKRLWDLYPLSHAFSLMKPKASYFL